VAVLVAASPIAIAAVSLIGDPWHPVGDWASMLYRTSRVGTAETPLVGAYTVKGWAHPGPFGSDGQSTGRPPRHRPGPAIHA
jgi:hypothetical protein